MSQTFPPTPQEPSIQAPVQPLIPEYKTPGPTIQQPAGPSPLTPEQLLAVKRAHERARKIRRASKVAFGDAAMMALFTFVCLASGIFDISGIVLGVALAVVTVNSFRGAVRLKNLDPAAARLLGINQIILAVAVIIYAVWCLVVVVPGASSMVSASDLKQINEMDPGMGAMLTDLPRLIMRVVYGCLIGGTIIAQGLMCLYYWTRGTHIRNYLAETPPWIIELQKHQSGR